MTNQPLSPDLEQLQAKKRLADDLRRRKQAYVVKQVEADQPAGTGQQAANMVNAAGAPSQEQKVADLVNEIPVGDEDLEQAENDGEEIAGEEPQGEQRGEQQPDKQDDEDRRRQEAERQLKEYQRQEAEARSRQAKTEAKAKQQQQQPQEQQPQTEQTKQKPAESAPKPAEEPYAKQGGPSIKPKAKGGIAKPSGVADGAASGEKAAGTAGRAASAVGRGAAKTGEAAAKAAQATAKAAAQAAKLAAQAAAWIGRALVFLVSNPYGWIILIIIAVIIIIIIIVVIVSGGLFGASATSPNPAGKSMTEIQPAYEIKGLFADIATMSNAKDIADTMQENKDKLTSEIQKIKTDLENPRFTDSPDKATALSILTELEKILNSVSTANPTQNQKLAEEFLKKNKELVAIWSASEETLPGTTVPIKATITSYGAGTHDCTIWDKSKCDVDGHRAVFGIREFESKVPITADAVDLGAPIGTQIYAPFAGKYEYKGGFYVEMEGASSNGVALEAELVHCKLNAGLSESGTVSIGQEICKLDKLKHLHFELKVNGKDVSRLTKGESESQLWKRMKKILSGQP